MGQDNWQSIWNLRSVGMALAQIKEIPSQQCVALQVEMGSVGQLLSVMDHEWCLSEVSGHLVNM